MDIDILKSKLNDIGKKLEESTEDTSEDIYDAIETYLDTIMFLLSDTTTYRIHQTVKVYTNFLEIIDRINGNTSFLSDGSNNSISETEIILACNLLQGRVLELLRK